MNSAISWKLIGITNLKMIHFFHTYINMINILLVVLLLLTAFHIHTRYSRKGRIIDRLPGYYAYPIVGNSIRFNTTCLHEFWKICRQLTKTYYPISRVWLTHFAIVSLRHPDDAEILLTNQVAIDKGQIYNSLHPWLKTGLITSTGNKWRQRRKILTPAFHFNILKKYLEIINEEGQKCIFDLKNGEGETVKNLMPFCSTFALNVICESAMGVRLDKMDSKVTNKYKKAIYDFGFVTVYRIPRPYIRNWMLEYLPGKLGNMQRNALKVLHNLTDQVVRERRAYHESTQNKYLQNLNDQDDDSANIGRKKRLAMLDLLLAAEQEGLIDHEGIKEEVDTFTFAGHDTIATALTFTLLLLAENKEPQDKARIEVTELMDRTHGKLEMTNLQELSYLERCIKESLRIFPPGATIFRYTPEDLQLKHGLVPGGSHMVLHIYDLHHDPNFWPEPEKFDPDRFLPENCINRHPFLYIPFSAGPRNCIGQKLVMVEMKTAIARILYDFELKPIDRSCDVKLIADMVLRSLNPISVKFVKIQK